MVKLETGATPFNPDQFKGQETYDPLGSYVSARHRVIAEHMPMPDGTKIWEVECRSCRHAYLRTSAQLSKTQPCFCDQKGRR
jgi:hypothetical protein